MKKIKILDTTLRDGEQTPGVALSDENKVTIAKALDDLGVDIIEAGSAIASEGEKSAIRKICSENLNAEILSFARIVKVDIDAAISCGVNGVFLVSPTSDIHITHKLRSSREAVLEKISESIQYCKKHGLVVDLCCEDGSRSDMDFLLKVVDLAVELNAERFTIADTVGIATPEKISSIFKNLGSHLEKSNKKILLGVHCHNDFGFATANTISAVESGAGVVDVTVNGLGERVGNAPLEEVAASLKFLYGYHSNIDCGKILGVSKLIEKLTGIGISRNKAIVGENAFTHGAGIHVDGILKNPETYEGVKPEFFGAKRRFVIGKLMGMHALKTILSEMNIEANDNDTKEIFDKVKFIADKGKHLTNVDLEVIANSVLKKTSKRIITLEELVAVSGNKFTPNASVKLNIDGKDYRSSAIGDGPVDAAISAIKNAAKEIPFTLIDYHVDSISGGSDATVRVEIKLESRGKVITSQGAGTDIILASVDAFINGLNLIASYT